MIDRWLHLTPAIDRFLNTRNNPAELNQDHGLHVYHTDIVDEIRFFLSLFNLTQETLASEKTPTLPFVLPSYENLINALYAFCGGGYEKLMHAAMAAIFKLEKYRNECRHSHLYMLAMGKLLLINLSFVLTLPSSAASRCKVALGFKKLV